MLNCQACRNCGIFVGLLPKSSCYRYLSAFVVRHIGLGTSPISNPLKPYQIPETIRLSWLIGAQPTRFARCAEMHRERPNDQPSCGESVELPGFNSLNLRQYQGGSMTDLRGIISPSSQQARGMNG